MYTSIRNQYTDLLKLNKIIVLQLFLNNASVRFSCVLFVFSKKNLKVENNDFDRKSMSGFGFRNLLIIYY